MSSVGQAVGMIVGGVIGFFAGGNVMLGAAIGGAIGAAIDPPKGPKIEGPRLDDLSVQTSTYGAPLGRSYGTVAVTGNIFWLEGDKLNERTKTEEQGGKGGGGTETTTYEYTATFAVGLLQIPDANSTASLRRLWIDTNLVYEAGSDNMDSVIASNLIGDLVGNIWFGGTAWGADLTQKPEQPFSFTFYDGSNDQPPNERMQADKGAANVSAYPGLCYIVINDLNLTEKYSNTLMRAQVKAELVIAPYTSDADYVGSLATGQYEKLSAAVITPGSIIYGVSFYDSFLESLSNYQLRQYIFGEGDFLILSASDSDMPINKTAGNTGPQLAQSFPAAGVAPVSVFIRGFTATSETQFITISAEGAVTYSQLFPNGDVDYSSPYGFVMESSTSGWGASTNTTVPIIRLDNLSLSAVSSVSIKASSIGVSENYLFAVDVSGSGVGATIIQVFDKSTLALLDTYVQSVDGSGALLYVVSDSIFYTRSSNHIYKWSSGIAQDLGAIAAPIKALNENNAFAVFADLPLNVVSLGWYLDYPHIAYMAHPLVSQTPAKLRDVVTAECSLAGIDAADIDLTGLTDSDVRGYRIAQRGSVRSSLEPLQTAYLFDVANSGYKIRFVSRGGASVDTIPTEDLGATDGGPVVLLPVSREMDSQIPAKVSVRYLDQNREYDFGEQFVERDHVASVDEWVIDLPLVMVGSEAAQLADILDSKNWTERRDFGPFTLPPTWRELEAADVITVEHRNQSHELRLTRVEYLPDGRIQCMAKATAAASYTSTATGEDPVTVGQSLVPLRGSTSGYLLDIPRIRSEQDIMGMCFGLLGLASGWPGGVLVRSDDSGNTWTSVGAMNGRARVFDASAALGAHHGYSADHAAVLTVTPRHASLTLATVNEELFYSQSNLAAYGVDGRWEIVSFQTVTDNTGSYTLRDFLRGLYGTEWASGLHAAGDLLIMLDTSTVGFFGLPTTALGAPRLYQAITQGAAINSAPNTTDTYDAVNLMPLSPVDISGWINSLTNDWTVTVIPRTRWPVEIFSGYATPSSESPESYVFEIYTSNTFATLARTITASLPTFDYLSAQQISDLGAISTTLYIKAYQVSATVGRGFPLTTSISSSVLPDPYINFVTSLIHFEGPNASTTIIDEVHANTWTAVGNAQLTTTGPLYGTSSLICDGTGDYVRGNGSSNFAAGTGDFTLEFSYTPAAIGTGALLIDFRPNTVNGPYHSVTIETSGVIGYYVNLAYRITGTTALVPGTRYRIAVSRVSGVTRLFVEGAQEGSSYTDAFTYAVGANRPYIGSNSAGAAPGANGKIDEWRYTKAGRYASGYIPSSPPFPNP